jgi:hypothetical protein
MERWRELACHPRGFVLATHAELKAPWVALRLTHPDWAERHKKHRFVWLNWNRAIQQVRPASKSPVTVQFIAEQPDICEWAVREIIDRGVLG